MPSALSRQLLDDRLEDLPAPDHLLAGREQCAIAFYGIDDTWFIGAGWLLWPKVRR